MVTKLKTKIAFIDDNGNAYLKAKDFKKNGFIPGDSLTIVLEGQVLEKIPFHSGFYCKMFETVLVSKDSVVFLAIRNGSAGEKFNLYEGQEILVKLEHQGTYWEKENAYSFTEIKNKDYYDSEESFANFRPLFHDSDCFYRSSSPVDNAYHRAESVRYCVKKYGIKTIIDMADANEELADLLMSLDKDSMDTFQSCLIHPIGDDSGLYSHTFEQSVLLALKLIISSETPCMIHCRAGKRRSGFVCAILQSLNGMTAEEIMSDYMISYKNNNGVTYEDNPRRYEYLKNDTIRKILYHINGKDLSNLNDSTIKYLERIGLGDNEIKKLLIKLR